jgi:hypothetical protein
MLPSIFGSRMPGAGFSARTAPVDRFTGKRCWLVILGLMLLLAQHHASADLMLNPTRIVFEKNQRSMQLDLINDGNETATYRISLVNRRMSETGEFSAIDSPLPGEQFADGLLRYSPRQVVLAPGAAQMVRILLRKPANLAPGEYRSHLRFEKVPETKGTTSVETKGGASGDELGIKLTALVGVSIPVIVRHGETEAEVTLSSLELQKPTAAQPSVLALRMARSGNRSVYGDLTASFTPQGGTEQIIAKAGGVAVYTPNAVRRAKLALKLPSGLALAHGVLRVTYRERPEEGGKLLAEAAIQLP